MAVCDANYKFTWVDIGGISDGGVWANSDFGRSLKRGQVDLPFPHHWPGMVQPMPFTFVGDTAFPLRIFMMRPYAKSKRRRNQGQQEEEEEINEDYNRDIWTILKGSIACSLETCETIVLALVVFHNFLLFSEEELPMQQQRYNVRGLADQEGPHGELFHGAWRREVPDINIFQCIGRMGGNNAAADAVRLRNNLRDYFVSEVGEIEWQYEFGIPNNPIMRGP
ncbi:nuclease harbi1-like protein [Lasius niger]|uniref:Nuclease harbi1-like protein n=1 Tax=Lasius niger TaxID=67767 RepID=A0A0J7K3E9_LASNI|nr:nuclease harbi1-like protein [Lasius niger]